MKILFVGVFDTNRQSTNTSQLLAFKSLGHDVVGYNYRSKAMQVGNAQRDKHLIDTIESRDFNLVVFSKCNVVGYEVFKRATAKTKTCLWFMDALCNYDEEMLQKSSLVSYVCCDKKNVLRESLKVNEKSFYVCEGFDQEVDNPHDVEEKYDVSFIGSIYGDRQQYIENSSYDIKTFNNVYGIEHAKVVGQSKINLNFCTSDSASDRVYKILAAGGFLLTNDWPERKENFIDQQHCVVFDGPEDLDNKIRFYLNNPEIRKQISINGLNMIQAFNRINWAKRIVELSNE
tara:strand:- start:297 stop:1160 length:864 start_codon:yes stop_codon:yes gene_type:complete